MAIFQADADKFYIAEQYLLDAYSILKNKSTNITECTSSHPKDYEYTSDVKEICEELNSITRNISGFVDTVSATKEKLVSSISGWSATYFETALNNYANFENTLKLGDDYVNYINEQYNNTDYMQQLKYCYETLSVSGELNGMSFEEFKIMFEYQKDKEELAALEKELDDLYSNPVKKPNIPGGRITTAQAKAYKDASEKYYAYKNKVKELEDRINVLRINVYNVEISSECAGLSAEQLKEKRKELEDQQPNALANFLISIFGGKKTKDNQEKIIQKINIYNSLINNKENYEFLEWYKNCLEDPEFQKKVEEGKMISKNRDFNGSPTTNVYEKEHLLGVDSIDSMAYEKYMTQEQIDMYYYVLATNNTYTDFQWNGYEAGQNYLKHFENTVNQAWGKDMGEAQKAAYEKANCVGKILMTTGLSWQQGLSSAFKGMNITTEKIFGFEDIDTSVSADEYAAGIFRENLLAKRDYEGNVIYTTNASGEQVAVLDSMNLKSIYYDTNQVVAHMVPSMVASAPFMGIGAELNALKTLTTMDKVLKAAINVPSFVTMWESSYGNKYKEMINQGYSDSQASDYAFMSATAETTLEKLTSAIPGIGMGAGTPQSSYKALVGDRVKDILMDAGGEVFQDTTSNFIGNQLLGQENNLSFFTEENLNTLLVSICSSIGMGSVGNVSNIVDIHNTKADICGYVYSATGAEVSYNQLVKQVKNGNANNLYQGLSIIHESAMPKVLSTIDLSVVNDMVSNVSNKKAGNIADVFGMSNINAVLSNLSSDNVNKVVKNMDSKTLRTVYSNLSAETQNAIQASVDSKLLNKKLGDVQKVKDAEVNKSAENNYVQPVNENNNVEEMNSNLTEQIQTIEQLPNIESINTEQIGNVDVETNNHTDVNQTTSVDNNFQSEILNSKENVEVLEVNDSIEMPKLVSENKEVNKVIDINLPSSNEFQIKTPFKVKDISFETLSDYKNNIDISELFDDSITSKTIKLGGVEISNLSIEDANFILDTLNIEKNTLTNENFDVYELNYLYTLIGERIMTINGGKEETYFYKLKNGYDNISDITISEFDKIRGIEGHLKEIVDTIELDKQTSLSIIDSIKSANINKSSINDVDFELTFKEVDVVRKIIDKTNRFRNMEILSELDLEERLILDKFLKSGAGNTILLVNDNAYNALFKYSSMSWTDFNKYLDSGIDKELYWENLKLSDMVDEIDSVMEFSKTDSTILLHRGTTIKEFENIELSELKGTILTQNRYKSTCKGVEDKIGTSRGGLATGADSDLQQVKIDYICPEGTKCVNLAAMIDSDIADEVLLGRNQRIRYDSVKMDGDTACVLAVVLPDGVSDNVSIRDLVDAKTYDLISSRYDLSENIEVLEIEQTNTNNLLTANGEEFNQVLDNIEQNVGQNFISDLSVEEFEEVLGKVSKDNYEAFSSILSQDTILNNMNKINQESYDKLVDVILSNPYETLVLSRNEEFLNVFANRSNDNTILQILKFNSEFALKLFNKIDTTKLNYLLSKIKNKNCFDDIFEYYYKNEIAMNSEREAINVYNLLNENGFATEAVNDYFSWLSNDNAYNINVNYQTNVENNNGIYSIRRTDGSKFDLKYLNKQELSNGNTVYSYEYTSGNSSVILYVDFNLSFMLDENLNIEQLVNNFLSVECIEQSINEYGYLGAYKLNSGEYEQVINKDNIGLIINETANQYYDFLDNYYDLNAGNTFGVDQHSTANMAKVNPKAFKELCKKFVSKGLSYRDAIKVMKSLDNTGACSYASVCNTIFGFYKDNPQAFKSDFGFDMFVYNSEYNYYSLNTTELLADLYLYVNNKSNNPNANLFEGIDKIKIVDKTWLGDIKTDNQQYLSGGWGVRVDLINKYLQSKNKSLDFNSEPLHYGQTINNLSDLEINEVRKIIGDSLATGKTVGLGISRDIYDTQGNPTKKGNIRFINADGNVYVDTNSWSEGAGHAVFITSVVENGVWVSSWGKKLYISFSDLQNASFGLYQNFIKGING